MRHIVNAAVIRDDCLLLVKEKGRAVWTLPGGEMKPDETEEECLAREIDEELAGVGRRKIFRYFQRVEGVSPGRKDVISVSVYLAELAGHVGAGSDVDNVVWAFNPMLYPLSDVTWKIVNLLRREKYLPPIP